MSRASLSREARRLAAALKKKKAKIVFAESCTGGLVAATLVGVPGISVHLCGSAVVYRDATKGAWLKIPAPKIRKFGAVSPEIAEAMAFGVLKQTDEADFAASITGHLGPSDAPSDDGLAYIGLVRRGSRKALVLTIHLLQNRRTTPRIRLQRQVLGASALLRASALFVGEHS